MPSFLSRFLAVSAALLTLCATPARAQNLTLANPQWNITLTDFGYSDFLLDNTPGFEGREYLSGEWGAAVSYQLSGGPSVPPQWLEPNFVYPDWTTNSAFTVVSPIMEIGRNADNLPIAESVIANPHVQITQRFEMIDTVTGTPMGTTPASAGGAGSSHASNRYVLRHTYTIRNISGATLSNLQLFQLLHGLNSQRGVHDDRVYSGPLSSYHYDTTLAGVDSWASGSTSPLEDYIAFHAAIAPTAHEVGHYGVEGNGLDNHGIGKPSEGVHLSIESNWLAAPYSSRLGTDAFTPPTRWVGGAQRWSLGTLAPNASTSIDVILSILTGTTVPRGNTTGSCDGGSSVPGGIDYEFASVETEGTCFSDFSRADESEVAVRIAAGEFSPFTFQTPSQPAQLWQVDFSGSFSGSVNVVFAYDATLLPPGFDPEALAIYHHNGTTWEKLPGVVSSATSTITVSTSALGTFALGADALTSYIIAADANPAAAGSVAGAGTYVGGSSVTVSTTPAPGFVFSHWSEGATVISASPTFTFLANADRTLAANYIPVGSGRVVATTSSPTAGGTTTGGGEYALGATATVTAVANTGYKFSKWQLNGVTVSSARTYSFPVAGNVTLVARFKPVYYVTVTAEPAAGGDPEADPIYEVGELAKLRARPNHGWSLVNWTQNGVLVSTDEDFQFNVTGNRDLVATYAPGSRIDLAADPKTAGDVSGGGVVPNGVPSTVTAIPRNGYAFLDWTENGSTVSTDAAYTFSATDRRTLIARFVALPRLVPTVSAPGAVTFTWADAPGWVLKESPDLTTWTISTRPTVTTPGQRSLTVDTTEQPVFFKLEYAP